MPFPPPQKKKKNLFNILLKGGGGGVVKEEIFFLVKCSIPPLTFYGVYNVDTHVQTYMLQLHVQWNSS